MSTYTPGPWINRGADGHAHVIGGNPSYLIADCANCRSENAEDRANARLIAAAPDLLDALQRIVKTGVGDYTSDPDLRLAINAARTAIDSALYGTTQAAIRAMARAGASA